MLRDNLVQLIKHTSIYSLGWFASMAAGVLLLPVYTRNLSVEDYGAVDLIQQSNSIFKVLFASAFTYSVGRFYHDSADNRQRSLTISTCSSAVLFAALFATLIGFVLKEPLGEILFGDTQHTHLVLAGVGIMFFDLAFLGFTYQYLVEKRSVSFVYLMLIKLVTGIVFTLWFVVWCQWGGLGMLIGNMASYIPVCCIALGGTIIRHGLRVDWGLLGKMVAFGAPMIPATLMATFMHNADRVLLRPLGSLEQVGFFTLALQFPSLVNSVLLTSFNSIWGGEAMFRIAKQSDGDYQISRIATYFMAAYVILQTLLGLFSSIILHILVDPKFYQVAAIIPVACMGYSVHALYLFLTTKAFTNGKPTAMIAAYGVACCVKVVLTFIFVPHFGYFASGWILAITYIAFSTSCFWLFRKLNTVRLEFGRIALLFLVSSFALGVSALVQSEHIGVNIAFQGIIAICLLSFWFLGPFLDLSEKRKLYAEASSAMHRLISHRVGSANHPS